MHVFISLLAELEDWHVMNTLRLPHSCFFREHFKSLCLRHATLLCSICIVVTHSILVICRSNVSGSTQGLKGSRYLFFTFNYWGKYFKASPRKKVQRIVMDLRDETNVLINSSRIDLRRDSIDPINRQNFKVYKKRWYILFMFFLCSALNGAKWNTWSPIQGTSQVVFGWSDATITLLVAWGPIVFIVMFLPLSWLMDAKGRKHLCFIMLYASIYNYHSLNGHLNKTYISLRRTPRVNPSC